MNTKMHLLTLTLLSIATASADQWKSSGFNNYWPKTVPVYIESNDHHTWTAGEKKIALRAMARKLWCQERTYAVQSVAGRESIGDRFKVREMSCEIVPVASRKGALIIVRVAPVPVSNTTVPSAGLPVTITIRPDQMTGFPSCEYGIVIDHEMEHLAGSTH